MIEHVVVERVSGDGDEERFDRSSGVVQFVLAWPENDSRLRGQGRGPHKTKPRLARMMEIDENQIGKPMCAYSMAWMAVFSGLLKMEQEV